MDVLTPESGAHPVRSDSHRLFLGGSRRRSAPPADVEDLAGVLRRSDGLGFKAIFKAFYVDLVHYVSVVVDSREDAEDIVQNVFTALWCHRRTLNVTSSSSLYLFSAVRHRAYDCLRQRATRSRAYTTAERAGAPAARNEVEPDPIAGAAERETELLTTVEFAIAALPERRRRALILRYKCELPEREIAELLEVEVGTVHTHLRLGLRSLREKLGKLRRDD
jgi:RNA polymerase sigma factor (sigma-70 family)